MWLGLIVTLCVGAICIVLGIQNMRGNISSLHSYHRHRVSEEDRLPFGRLIGLGTIIAGASIIFYGLFMLLSEILSAEFLVIIGLALMILGMIVGLGLVFFAMIKYNRGIF